jgi:predicted Zn-dependent peptidase
MLSLAFLVACGGKGRYVYESVKGDPLKTRIYTLDNGLKVYLSVNRDKPRIQTFIGCRVGAKNDPAETTGLAHYLEHLMFKGTASFGTSDFEAEKPLLDSIEALYETYRVTRDEGERRLLYARIDSVSQAASLIAIPNEYDKLMSAIGAQGTNAFTSYDMTAYMEDIPSNEVESWAAIEAERFANPVIRLFHTELETVYEEYNMSLTSDSRRVYEAALASLFPHHPYGTQTVIGSQDHLKNPSITNIKRYYETYYVPNNMAVCMVGDLDPDLTIAIIDKYFGGMAPGEVPPLVTQPEEPVTEPVTVEVTGLEAESVRISYRMPPANTREAATMEFVDYLLTNGKAGLIDLNLVQQQKALEAGSTTNAMADYSTFDLYGTPKEGQTLDEVKELLLGQVDLLRKGDFSDDLLTSVINNFRLEQYLKQEEYTYAAFTLLDAFINRIDWEDEVSRIDYQSRITREDVIDFCNKYYRDNYVVVYKRQGKRDDTRIDKPAITPVPANRDLESPYLEAVRGRKTAAIEPVFVDYEKDMEKLTLTGGLPLLYKQNTTNPVFSLHYVFEMGNNHDRTLGTAFTYLDYLGTSTRTAEEIKSELYSLACSFGVQATDERVYVSVSGLSDNFGRALAILEERLADARADEDAYRNLADDIIRERVNAKADQYSNSNALSNYAVWGSRSPFRNILSKDELRDMNPADLVETVRSLTGYEHTVLYYGPLTGAKVVEALNFAHVTPGALKPVPEPAAFTQQATEENTVLVAHYDAEQIYMSMFHRGGGFDKGIEVPRIMYSTYFGGGMNSIVFQEMRETRGLAYSAQAIYQRPGKPDRAYYLRTFIATQTDKLSEATNAFLSILNEMPESERAFEIAKESIITGIRTDRILRDDVLWSYLSAREFGYDTDQRREQYELIPHLTLSDVKSFQEQYVKGKPFTYCILGDTKALDMTFLNSIGKVTLLTREEIFGY